MGIKPPVTLSFELLAASRCLWFPLECGYRTVDRATNMPNQKLAELREKSGD
jgi:hypothetical protein